MPSFRHDLRGRFVVLLGIIVGVLGILLVRLWVVQVLNGPYYARQAEDNRIREIALPAPRGRILDRHGDPLVVNRSTLAVAIAPSVRSDENLMLRLSNVLSIPVDEIRERAASSREEALAPRTVAVDVPLDTIAYLAEHESQFPGVEIQPQAVREYPNGSLAAHVVGYTGEISEAGLKSADEESGYRYGDIVGKAGAERSFEKVLQGVRGRRVVEVDASGEPRRVISEDQPIPGADVVLTIDAKVQRVAEQALAQAMKDAHQDGYPAAKAGAAVAIDTRTGEVLAMASAPTYDPKLFLGGISKTNWKRLNAKNSEFPLTNRAVMAQYAPASTFKAFTGLAGLEHKVTSAWTAYYCAGKWTEMGKQWPKWCWNHSGHGMEAFIEGVEDSCDVVFYEIGYTFYKDKGEKLQKFARRYGFGSTTGIDLPGEVDGRVPDAKWKSEFNKNYPEYRQWLPGDTVNIAIGQGDLLATPIQLASAYAGVGNGGVVMRPHVLKQVLGSQSTPAYTEKPSVLHATKTSKASLATMRVALERVTTQGTGQGAFRGFPARVAGKTGTAEVAGKDDYALFAAYAPAEKPRYAVVVIIEQGGHGGSIAAPAARDILSALLGYKIRHVTASDNSR